MCADERKSWEAGELAEKGEAQRAEEGRTEGAPAQEEQYVAFWR